MTTFTYDGDGGRISRVTPNDTTYFIGSLFDVKVESAKVTYTKHVFMGSTRISSKESSTPGSTIAPSLRGSVATEAVSFYHGDHLGSTSDITDALGNLKQHTEYLPYGEIYIQEGEQKTDYLYTGKLFDTSTGLYYYGARYYDPEIARFTQADSIIPEPGNPQSFNRYAYCDNNPINYTDPTGHLKFKDLWGQIIGAVAGVIANIIVPGSGVIVYSAVSAAITASMNGASFGQALGYGAVAGFAAFAGGQFGQALGGALGLGSYASGILAGVAGGAAGGATGAALMGGDVVKATFAGMAGGGIGMAIPGVGAVIGGGVASEIAGGNFWEGAAGGAAYAISAAITSGAYQAARDMAARSNEGTSLTPKMSTVLEKQHKVDEAIAQSAVKPGSSNLSNNQIKVSNNFGKGIITKSLAGAGGALMAGGVLTGNPIALGAGVVLVGAAAVNHLISVMKLYDTGQRTATDIYNKTGMKEHYETIESLSDELKTQLQR